MKNKKAAYLLLPIVILIWGYIGYRVIDYVEDDPISPVSHAVKVDPVIHSEVPDEFELLLNYRDPFLGDVEKPMKKASLKNDQNPKVQKPAIATEVPWPKIAYGGMIKSNNTGINLASINIGGSSHMLRGGEIADGVKVLFIYRDSVRVEFANSKKTIVK